MFAGLIDRSIVQRVELVGCGSIKKPYIPALVVESVCNDLILTSFLHCCALHATTRAPAILNSRDCVSPNRAQSKHDPEPNSRNR